MFPDLTKELTPEMLIPAKSKKLLFLDCDGKRIQMVLEWFSPTWHVTIAANVKECLGYLARQDFDEVYLEHDLRGIEFEDPDSSLSGMEVVRYIEKCGWPGGKPKPIFRVHTSNIFAAHLMVKRLQALDLIAVYQRFDEGKL